MNVLVGNLRKNVTHKQLYKLFEGFGRIGDVTVSPGLRGVKLGGIAVVDILDPKEAERAIQQLDGVYWRGSSLEVKNAPFNARSLPRKYNRSIGQAQWPR